MEHQHRSLDSNNLRSLPFKFHHNMFKNTTSQTKQTMDNISETISLIHHGCNLARDLESNLPNLANQPENLFPISKSLDEIMRIFREARERLHSSSAAHQDPLSSYVHVAQQQQQIDASLQEWLRCNYTPAMEDHYIQTQRLIAESSAATPSDMRDSGGDQIQAMVSHDMNVSSSSQSRPRRRKDLGEIRKLTVPAPRIGNTEIPPEDGFTWRKYGQKEIMGCRFPRTRILSSLRGEDFASPSNLSPLFRNGGSRLFTLLRWGIRFGKNVRNMGPPFRNGGLRLLGGKIRDPVGEERISFPKCMTGYYRCTHQKLYNCPAKKQVQRLDNDPLTFEVMYRGDHTCHMSSTAPSTLPPPPDQIKQDNMTQNDAATTQPLGWLSMDFNTSVGGSGSGGDGVGTSTATTTRYGKEVEFPVVDFADAMFNSGSSSSNSMDLIFTNTYVEDKWESGDKKN